MPLEIVRSNPTSGDDAVPRATAEVRDRLQQQLAELIDLGLTTLDRARVVVGDPSWVNSAGSHDPGCSGCCVVQGHIDY